MDSSEGYDGGVLNVDEPVIDAGNLVGAFGDANNYRLVPTRIIHVGFQAQYSIGQGHVQLQVAGGVLFYDWGDGVGPDMGVDIYSQGYPLG